MAAESSWGHGANNASLEFDFGDLDDLVDFGYNVSDETITDEPSVQQPVDEIELTGFGSEYVDWMVAQPVFGPDGPLTASLPPPASAMIENPHLASADNLGSRITSPRKIPVDESCYFTIRGLPIQTTVASLRSAIACSSEFLEAKILVDDPQHIPGCLSARMLFSSPSGAEIAKKSIEGMLQLVDKDCPMRFEMHSSSEIRSDSVEINHTPAPKRHNFSKHDKSYLEKQFQDNSRPTSQQRRVFAAKLGVEEKHIQTWFNNRRQRQRSVAKKNNSGGNATVPIPISRKRLSQMSLDNEGLATSPIERFRASPPGCDGESSLEVIAAAARLAATDIQKSQGLDSPGTVSRKASMKYPSIPLPPIPTGEYISRRIYTKSVTSAASSQSHKSDQSGGSGLSAGSTRSGVSSASIVTRGSNISSISRLSGTSKVSRISKKSRYDPKQFVRKTRKRLLGTAWQMTNPDYDKSLPTPQADSDISQTNLQASIAITCYLCEHVSHTQTGRCQLCTFSCANCLQFLGECQVADGDKALIFRLCCHNCRSWVEATITNKCVDGGKDTVDYSYDCDACHKTLFEATVTNSRRFYDCTFCTMTFGTKYGWLRHETTIHHQQQTWICWLGTPVPLPESTCPFCDADDVPINHDYHTHRLGYCTGRPVEERSFCRKDQLIQHLRRFHKCSKLPLLTEQWRKTIDQPDRVYECGVCNFTFTTWTERLTHIGKHWDEGLNRSNWKSNCKDQRGAEAIIEIQDLPEEQIMPNRPNQPETTALMRHDVHYGISQSAALPPALVHAYPSFRNSGFSDLNPSACTSATAGPRSASLQARSQGPYVLPAESQRVDSGFWNRVKPAARSLSIISANSYTENLAKEDA